MPVSLMGDIRRVPAVLILPCSYACIACDLLALILKSLCWSLFSTSGLTDVSKSVFVVRVLHRLKQPLFKNLKLCFLGFSFASAQSAVEPFQMELELFWLLTGECFCNQLRGSIAIKLAVGLV